MDLFLIEKGQYVILRKNGVEVGFSSFEEFKKHSGINLTGKEYVCYQPNEGFEIDDSKPGGKIDPGFKTVILTQLDKVDTYKANKANPYFSKSSIEKTEIKKNQIKSEATAYIQKAFDLPTQVTMQAIYCQPGILEAKKTKIESVWGWIQSILVYSYQKKAAVDADFETGWDYSTFDKTKPAVTLLELFETGSKE